VILYSVQCYALHWTDNYCSCSRYQQPAIYTPGNGNSKRCTWPFAGWRLWSRDHAPDTQI